VTSRSQSTSRKDDTTQFGRLKGFIRIDIDIPEKREGGDWRTVKKSAASNEVELLKILMRLQRKRLNSSGSIVPERPDVIHS